MSEKPDSDEFEDEEADEVAGDEESLLARATELLREAFFPDNCGFILLDADQGRLHHARSFHSHRSPDELAPQPEACLG